MTARAFYDGATLHVRSYDSVHAHHRALDGDIAFYQTLAQRAGGNVLEIGIGTGRVGVALAQAGLDVTGLDASAPMLAFATAKANAAGCTDRLSLQQGDMRDFTLPRQFGSVIVPFHAFQVLLSVADQRAALACFRRHLRPDGVLALHLFDPNLTFLQPGVSMPDVHGVDAATGRAVTGIMQNAEFDYLAQTRHDTWCYRAFGLDGMVAEEEILRLSLRWTFRWELQHLLALCGFSVEASYSDFHASPPVYASEQIVLARPTA